MSEINNTSNKIEVIFKDYEEVCLNKNGFSVTFKDSQAALDAFKSFTSALDEIDKDKGQKTLGLNN